MKVEFLPPYSPDYNPIGLAFSTIKALLRWCDMLMHSLQGRGVENLTND